MTLKSLAHKDWPYAGTPHAWRGMVSDPKGELNLHRNALIKFLEAMPSDATADEMLAMVRSDEVADQALAVYQKQNFGPELK